MTKPVEEREKRRRIRGIVGLRYLSREREAWLNFVQDCGWSAFCGFCEVERFSSRKKKWIAMEWGVGCLSNDPKDKGRHCTMRNCPKRKEWWPPPSGEPKAKDGHETVSFTGENRVGWPKGEKP